jgi:protein-tyrosine phosphatase
MEERLARKLDPEALRPMLGVELGYLHATLDEINARSGSVERYLSDVLGVGQAERAEIRAKLIR